jgi:hypothetical protein
MASPKLAGVEESSVKANREGVRVGTAFCLVAPTEFNCTYEDSHKHQPFAAL